VLDGPDLDCHVADATWTQARQPRNTTQKQALGSRFGAVSDGRSVSELELGRICR
jgi:hypothetical protein